jgi:hypothetical protein
VTKKTAIKKAEVKTIENFAIPSSFFPLPILRKTIIWSDEVVEKMKLFIKCLLAFKAVGLNFYRVLHL